MRRHLAAAEVLAWPFSDGGALRAGESQLPSSAPASLRARLARHPCAVDAERMCALHWGEPSGSTVRAQPLALLGRIAAMHLRPAGVEARLVPMDESPGEELLRWRALSLFIPPTLLLGASEGPGRPPARVRLLDPTLRPARRLAHLHLHLGAARSFAHLWSRLAVAETEGRLGGPPSYSDDIADGEWREALAGAFAVRAWAAGPGRRDPPSHLLAWSRSPFDPAWRRSDVVYAREWSQKAAIRANARGRRVVRHDAGEVALDAWEDDPAADGAPTPEVVVVQSLLRAAEGNSEVALVALQYVRVQTTLYRMLVFDPTDRGGLSAFVDVYKRVKPYVHEGSPEEAVSSLVAEERADLRLEAVELRVTPPKGLSHLESMLRAAGRLPVAEAALVIHFSRAPDAATGLEWLRHARHLELEAGRLARWIKATPELLRHIRGVDLAGDERCGPLWLALSAIRLLRTASVDAARGRPNDRLIPLRLTLHVGEGFDHLLTGLRRIHEPLRWGMFERGDRLGHATALGMGPREWAAGRPAVPMIRFDRLVDLAWVLDRSRASAVELPPNAADRLGDEFERTLRAVGVEDATGLTPTSLLDWMGTGEVTLHPRVFGDPAGVGWARLFAGALTPVSVGVGPSRMFEVVEVSTERDVPVMLAMREYVQRVLAAWQVTLELNPTSNMLLSGLAAPLAQGPFRLRPDEPDEHALPLTLSTDDPITFATCLGDELAYAWAGLTRREGIRPGRARAWLEDAAEASWRARFTVPYGAVEP